jgi:hypothetical protein
MMIVDALIPGGLTRPLNTHPSAAEPAARAPAAG